MSDVQIIIAEWGNYAPYREKLHLLTPLQVGLVPLLRDMALYVPGASCEAQLIINDLGDSQARQYDYLKREFPLVKEILFQGNTGRDFGAYNTGYQALKKRGYEGYVLFLNTAIKGPDSAGWLSDMTTLFEVDKRLGLYGISVSSHHVMRSGEKRFGPHVQSYCLMSTMAILRAVFPDDLPGIHADTRGEAIHDGEVAFSNRILEAGYALRCKQLPQFRYSSGEDWPTEAGESRFRVASFSAAQRL